jgi:SAM-dependent MidA family methyltransferase
MNYAERIARDLRRLGSVPHPSAEAIRHGERVDAHLRALADQNGGSLPFDRFMEEALYAPGLGYYAAGATKFGGAGDFVTAPEMSPLFGACMAQTVRDAWEQGADRNILEIGPGTGLLAVSILDALHDDQCPPAQYMMLERSAELRERQRATLATRRHADPRLEWLDDLPDGFSGVIVANEVLDAMACAVWKWSQGQLLELHASPAKDGWKELWLPANPELQAWFDALRSVLREPIPDGYISEAHLQATGWIKTLASVADRAVVLLADYGFPRHEYYHPQRPGTLMCHYRHHAHDQPFLLPGLQDITCHVDFTAIAETASEAGWHVAGYTDQASFLMNTGITNRMTSMAAGDPERMVRLAQQAKMLMLPSEMGELFKVMALTRGLPHRPLLGFTTSDRRARL